MGPKYLIAHVVAYGIPITLLTTLVVVPGLAKYVITVLSLLGVIGGVIGVVFGFIYCCEMVKEYRWKKRNGLL